MEEKINIGSNVYLPMPVALVGSVYYGKTNFMEVGWISRVNANPPMICIGVNKGHQTCIAVLRSKVFSVNFPDPSLVAETDFCGLNSAKDTDKSQVFETFTGQLKNAPMISKCPLCMECRLEKTMEFASNIVFVAKIVACYTQSEYITDGRIDFEKVNPLFVTMPDNRYWTLGENIAQAWHVGREFVPSDGNAGGGDGKTANRADSGPNPA